VQEKPGVKTLPGFFAITNSVKKLSVFLCLEAITAIYRTVVLWLEWNLSLLAALSAYYSKHLTLLPATFAITAATSLVAAITAAYRLVLKALLCIKFLFSCAKDELLATVLTR
jgi:hypothetical protein